MYVLNSSMVTFVSHQAFIRTPDQANVLFDALTAVLHLLIWFIFAVGNSITGQLEVDAFSIPTLILSVDVAGGILCCKGRMWVWKYYCTNCVPAWSEPHIYIRVSMKMLHSIIYFQSVGCELSRILWCCTDGRFGVQCHNMKCQHL